jgi:hypothetical protein
VARDGTPPRGRPGLGRIDGAPAPRRSRALVGAAVVVAVVVAALLSGIALATRSPPPAPEADRYAVEQVAQRFRALGAGLLDGALRCSPLDRAPAEPDHVTCDFGAWSVDLVEYGSTPDLLAARDRATAAGPDVARTAATRTGDGSFGLAETVSGTSTVRWDSAVPRPVSATVSTSALTLPQLLAFTDTRGFALVDRPEPPGAAFASGRLWVLAGPFVERLGGTCGPLPGSRSYPGSTEAVRCVFGNGADIDFVLVANPDDFTEYRDGFTSDYLTLPGTRRTGPWPGGGPDGRWVEYVQSQDGDSRLYFDRPELGAFGLVFHRDLDQPQLRAFWDQVGQAE